MKGTEVRLDIAEVDPGLLADGEKLAKICAAAAEEAGATVVKVSWANLGNGDGTPPGATVAILLNESHLTLHTYSDEGLAALNVFTCGKRADPLKAAGCVLTALHGRLTFRDVNPRFAAPGESNGW